MNIGLFWSNVALTGSPCWGTWWNLLVKYATSPRQDGFHQGVILYIFYLPGLGQPKYFKSVFVFAFFFTFVCLFVFVFFFVFTKNLSYWVTVYTAILFWRSLAQYVSTFATRIPFLPLSNNKKNPLNRLQFTQFLPVNYLWIFN